MRRLLCFCLLCAACRTPASPSRSFSPSTVERSSLREPCRVGALVTDDELATCQREAP